MDSGIFPKVLIIRNSGKNKTAKNLRVPLGYLSKVTILPLQMNKFAYSLPAPKLIAPIIRDDGSIQFTEGGQEQVDQYFLLKEQKLLGIKYTEVLTPEDDDIDYWDDLLRVLDNRDLFIKTLKMIASPFEEPQHFSFKGPLTKEQRHSIHKMSRKGEFKTMTTIENGVSILNVFLIKF